MSPEVTLAYLENVGGQVERLAHETDGRRILVDSVSRLADLVADARKMRRYEYSFIGAPQARMAHLYSEWRVRAFLTWASSLTVL